MAAYWTGRSVAAGSLGKRFLHQIRAASPLPAVSVASPVIPSRVRAVHESWYDKNVDEQVRPGVVPDYVIDGGSSDKYWGPHPTTGVFGPADDCGASAAGIGGKAATGTEVSGSSEVEKTVWFRLQEGVDKAPYA
ncbi:late embryogenesis abundant protein At5g17165-like [Curcuma longa]|uniref:late embryogenesis abundant protein At5g17165-like n=1 Tax=Curcuma longa TaxID=136217 RepID=UPI003D9E88C6